MPCGGNMWRRSVARRRSCHSSADPAYRWIDRHYHGNDSADPGIRWHSHSHRRLSFPTRPNLDGASHARARIRWHLYVVGAISAADEHGTIDRPGRTGVWIVDNHNLLVRPYYHRSGDVRLSQESSVAGVRGLLGHYWPVTFSANRPYLSGTRGEVRIYRFDRSSPGHRLGWVGSLAAAWSSRLDRSGGWY